MASFAQLPQLSHLKRVIEVVPPERADQEHSEGEDEDEDPILSSGLSHGTAPQVDTSMTYPTPASNTITCTQEIFYSSTWSTPVLYLQAHHTETGHPLCLEEMMDPRLGVFLPGEDGEGSSSTPQRGAGTVRRSRLHALLPQSSAAAAGDRENGSEDGETLTEPLAEDGALPVSNEDRIAPAYFPPLSQSDHPITSLPCISLHPCQTAVVIGEMMQARSVIQEKDDDHREESVYGKEYLEAFITICANAVEMRG